MLCDHEQEASKLTSTKEVWTSLVNTNTGAIWGHKGQEDRVLFKIVPTKEDKKALITNHQEYFLQLLQ